MLDSQLFVGQRVRTKEGHDAIIDSIEIKGRVKGAVVNHSAAVGEDEPVDRKPKWFKAADLTSRD